MITDYYNIPLIFVPTFMENDWDGLENEDKEYINRFQEFLTDSYGKEYQMSIRGKPRFSYNNDLNYPYTCEIVSLEIISN